METPVMKYAKASPLFLIKKNILMLNMFQTIHIANNSESVKCIIELVSIVKLYRPLSVCYLEKEGRPSKQTNSKIMNLESF